MELYVKYDETGSTHDSIDLDDIWDDVQDESSEQELFEQLVAAIALLAWSMGSSFDEVRGYTLDDDDGNELTIDADAGDHSWIREVAQLIYFFKKSNKHWMPDGATLGKIAEEGWRSVNFEVDLEDWEDTYHDYIPDQDYSEYARAYMDNNSSELPTDMQDHFDYDAYGEQLALDYTEVTWGGDAYLFN